MALSRCRSRLVHAAAALAMLCAVATALLQPGPVTATPTGDFYEDGVDIFDDWDICRTRADGADGFLSVRSSGFEPVIAAEGLGSNADVAYVRGFQFELDYPDPTMRAEAIFLYVRDRVHYTSDRSQFGYDEFAQNADELLEVVDKDGFAYGDCEDYAILLGTMFLGAGLRSAVALTPDHAAALVYLPDYKRANRLLTVKGETGWVWAEATGGNNPLGWMPENYMRSTFFVRELEDEGLPPDSLPDKVAVSVPRHTNSRLAFPVSPFFVVVVILWLMSVLGRRRSASWW